MDEKPQISVSHLVKKLEAERRKKALLTQKALSSGDVPVPAASVNFLQVGDGKGNSVTISNHLNVTLSRNAEVDEEGVISTPSSTSQFATAISAKAAALRQRGSSVPTQPRSSFFGKDQEPPSTGTTGEPQLFRKVNGKWVETAVTTAFFQSQSMGDTAESITDALPKAGFDRQLDNDLITTPKPSLDWITPESCEAQPSSAVDALPTQRTETVQSAVTTSITTPDSAGFESEPSPSASLSISTNKSFQSRADDSQALNALATNLDFEIEVLRRIKEGKISPTARSFGDSGINSIKVLTPSSDATSSLSHDSFSPRSDVSTLPIPPSPSDGSDHALDSSSPTKTASSLLSADSSTKYSNSTRTSALSPVSLSSWDRSGRQTQSIELEETPGPRTTRLGSTHTLGGSQKLTIQKLDDLMGIAAALEQHVANSKSPEESGMPKQFGEVQGAMGIRREENRRTASSSGLSKLKEDAGFDENEYDDVLAEFKSCVPGDSMGSQSQRSSLKSIRKGSKQDLGYVGREPLLEKIGTISGSDYQLLVSQGNVHALSVKDKSTHPSFPLDLQKILSADFDGSTATVTYLSNEKGDNCLMDVDIEFKEKSTATKWAMTLFSRASKGNVMNVTDKEAIILADQEDKKAVLEIIQKQMIPLMHAARKPFDIMPVEFSPEKIEETLVNLDVKRVNVVACVTTKRLSSSIENCLKAFVARTFAGDIEKYKVISTITHPVDASLLMIKEPLQFSQFCAFNLVLRQDRSFGRTLRSKLKKANSSFR